MHCRKKDNATYEGTTWQIKFLLDEVNELAEYKLRLALATANVAELEVQYKFKVFIFLMNVKKRCSSATILLTTFSLSFPGPGE